MGRTQQKQSAETMELIVHGSDPRDTDAQTHQSFYKSWKHEWGQEDGFIQGLRRIMWTFIFLSKRTTWLYLTELRLFPVVVSSLSPVSLRFEQVCVRRAFPRCQRFKCCYLRVTLKLRKLTGAFRRSPLSRVMTTIWPQFTEAEIHCNPTRWWAGLQATRRSPLRCSVPSWSLIGALQAAWRFVKVCGPVQLK